MLAVARERHPRQSVSHIRLLSSPDPPGGGGQGVGGEGGMNKALKRLQSRPAKPLIKGGEQPSHPLADRARPVGDLCVDGGPSDRWQ